MNKFLLFSAAALLQLRAGAQWTPQATGLIPVGHCIVSLDAVDANTVWAVTGNMAIMWGGQPVPASHQARVLRTVDGGETWQTFDPPPMLGRVPFTLEAVSAQEVHITVCNSLYTIVPAVLASTYDGGATWSVRTQAQVGNAIGLFVVNFDADHWFLYGYDNAARSSDGGATWTSAPVPQLNEANGEFLIYSSTNNTITRLGDRLWIPTSQGRIFHSSDKGATWTTLLTPFYPQRSIVSMAFHSPERGMGVSCIDDNIQYIPTQVIVTFDGGSTWEVRQGPPGPMTSLVAVPGVPGAYIGVVEGDAPTAATYLTLDDGQNWQEIDADQPYNGLKFVDSSTGWTGLGMGAVDASSPAIFKWSGGSVPVPETIAATEPFLQNTVLDDMLRYTASQAGELVLLDGAGRIVRRFRVNGPASIPVSDLMPGSYLVELRADGRRGVMRVVKP